MFAIRLYLEAWFTAPCSCSAYFQDLCFLKAIHQYPNQNISNTAIKNFLGHLWYLSEELTALEFFDDNIPTAEKRKMIKALDKAGMENPSKRATVGVNMKELLDFITSNDIRFFEITRLRCDFLQQDPALWKK